MRKAAGHKATERNCSSHRDRERMHSPPRSLHVTVSPAKISSAPCLPFTKQGIYIYDVYVLHHTQGDRSEDLPIFPAYSVWAGQPQLAGMFGCEERRREEPACLFFMVEVERRVSSVSPPPPPPKCLPPSPAPSPRPSPSSHSQVRQAILPPFSCPSIRPVQVCPSHLSKEPCCCLTNYVKELFMPCCLMPC